MYTSLGDKDIQSIRIEGPITATLSGTEVEIVRNGSDCNVINWKDDTFTISVSAGVSFRQSRLVLTHNRLLLSEYLQFTDIEHG